MLDGIGLSLVKAIQYIVFYLGLFVRFSKKTFLKKVSYVVIHLVVWFWFMPYNYFTKSGFFFTRHVFPQNLVFIRNPSDSIGLKNSIQRPITTYKIQTCSLVKHKCNWRHLASVIDCRTLVLMLL